MCQGREGSVSSLGFRRLPHIPATLSRISLLLATRIFEVALRGGELALIRHVICYLLPKFQNSALVENRGAQCPRVRKGGGRTRSRSIPAHSVAFLQRSLNFVTIPQHFRLEWHLIDGAVVSRQLTSSRMMRTQ